MLVIDASFTHRSTESASRYGQMRPTPRAVPAAPSMKMLQEIVRVD